MMRGQELGLASPARVNRLRWSSATGIASAVFLAVCVNLLSARFDRRWDSTSDRRFTLSSATHETLAAVREPVRAVVLLSRADPMATTVQQVLATYLSSSQYLDLKWIDPDRDPGQFLAQQSALGITPGATKEGKSVTDAIIVLTRGKLRSYVTIDDIVHVDPNTGASESRLEQALTRGLRQLIDPSRPLVCVTQGHRELNPQDEGANGISEFYTRLSREPLELKLIDLGAGRRTELERCRVVVVAAPDIPLSAWAQQQLRSFLSERGSLLILSNTVPGDSGRVRLTGLNPVIASASVSIESNVVVELDEARRIPDGFGETFFAQVSDHAVTRSLMRTGPENSLHVLVSLAPSLLLSASSASKVLLTSTDKAFAVEDVGAYLRDEPNRAVSPPPGRRQILAAASEIGSGPSGLPRRLVVAPASLIENKVFRVPALAGNRAFVDGALTWLLSSPVGIQIPNPRGAVMQMNLSEADLTRLHRYVVWIMPAAAASVGFALALARRRRRRSQVTLERS